MKTLTLKQIAESLGAKLIGNPDEQITGLNGIEEAEKGDIAFLANPKYKDHLPNCKASAVIVGLDVETPDINLLQVDNPRLAYGKVMLLMFPPKAENTEISDRAFISETAEIGDNATVYAGAYVGDRTKIGKNVVIYPGVYIGDDVLIGDDCFFNANVSVSHGCQIGNRVILNMGCVIGSEGYAFEREAGGDAHLKIPQVGNVIIEDDVEVGALCAIDRGSPKATVIGRGTKFDNQVHIAHNCQIGEHNLIMAQVCLAGSVKTGKNVVFVGQAGCDPHINIVDDAQFFGKSGVTQNVEEPGLYAGMPARPFVEWQRASLMFYRTDEQRKKLNALEKQVNELEAQLSEKS